MLLLLAIWTLGICGFELAAQAQMITQGQIKTDDIIQDVSSQMSLIKWGVGAIVTALCGAIGLLYRTLLETHGKMITLLEKESSARLDMVEKAAVNFTNVGNSLEEFAVRLSEFNRRIDMISSGRMHNKMDD